MYKRSLTYFFYQIILNKIIRCTYVHFLLKIRTKKKRILDLIKCLMKRYSYSFVPIKQYRPF